MKKKENVAFTESCNSEIFTDVYQRNLWGGKAGEFYSGPGSHNSFIEDYAKVIANFIVRNNLCEIVEIGCGDFNVSKKLLTLLDEQNFKFSYTGYDVVETLIARNEAMFGSHNIKFVYKDACIENINKGDVLIVRQVLQHLDNKSITAILNKFPNYNYIIVTEHQASAKYGSSIVPNKDQETGPSVRLLHESGVYLDQEPFNCSIDCLLFSIPEYVLNIEASINTFLIKSHEIC